MNLLSHDKIIVQQRRELIEFLGFETRNKYEISDENKNLIGFCAEQNKGILGFLFRQFLGHWRSFELHFFDHNRQFAFKSIHPFRFFFQEFSVVDSQGVLLGRIYQRFGIFTKKFDIADAQGQVIMTMRSGFFSFWTYAYNAKVGVGLNGFVGWFPMLPFLVHFEWKECLSPRMTTDMICASAYQCH